jgi:hypothetical protein
MRSTVATVQRIIEASTEDAFKHIVPIDLTSIFTGYGPLPAVTETPGPDRKLGRRRPDPNGCLLRRTLCSGISHWL